VNIRQWLKERGNRENYFACPPNSAGGQPVPTGVLDEKYRIHPIDSLCLFHNVGSDICPALLVASDNKTVHDLLSRVLLKPVQRLFNRGEEGLTHSSAMGNLICV
jgi:hypothetical protein